MHPRPPARTTCKTMRLGTWGLLASFVASVLLGCADASTPDAHDAGRDAGPTAADASLLHEGQCAFEGMGVYRDGAYSGTVAYVLFAEPFGDEELCRVQLDVATVADADPACDVCDFSTRVALSNPVVITDVDDACAHSERALDAAAIKAMVQTAPVAIGFAEEATGHGQVLLEYDPTRMRWTEVAFGSYDADTGALTYEQNEGFCRYE